MKKNLIGLLALSLLFVAGLAVPGALAQPRGGRGEGDPGAFARSYPGRGFRGGGYPGRGLGGGYRGGGYPGGGYPRGGNPGGRYPGGGYGSPQAFGSGGGYGRPGFAPPRALYGAPGGFGGGLRAFTRGQFLPPGFGAGVVVDPRQYHLRRPPNGYGWVTVGPNAYLTQRSTGLILDTAPLY